MRKTRKDQYARKDFTEADLPGNRKEVFVSCYHDHFFVILRLGLYCLLFLIPMLMVQIMKDGYVLGVYRSLENPSPEDIAAIYAVSNVLFGMFEAAAMAVFFFLFSGLVQIVRQLLWRGPIFLNDTFKKGMKQNYGRFLQVILLIVLPEALLKCLTPSVAVDFLQGFWAVILVPIGVWVLLQTVYYQLGFGASVRNAMAYYIKTFLITLVLLLVTALPFYLMIHFAGLALVKYFGLIVLAIFYIVPVTMLWLLYASHIFDRHINQEHYPSLYRKGMRSESGE